MAKPVRKSGPTAPKAERPSMPKDYRMRRSSGGLLPWSYVEKRMAGAHNFWIGSSGTDGVWVERKFFFGTDRKSRKARNPAAVVHLESGDAVVILEGTAAEVTDRAKLAANDDAFHRRMGCPSRPIRGMC